MSSILKGSEENRRIRSAGGVSEPCAGLQPAHGFLATAPRALDYLKNYLHGAGSRGRPGRRDSDPGLDVGRGGPARRQTRDRCSRGSAPAGADAFRAKLPDGKTAAPLPPVAVPSPSGPAGPVAVPAPPPADAPEVTAALRPAPTAQAAKPAIRAVPKETPQAPPAERPPALPQRAAPARETPPTGAARRPPGLRRTTSAAWMTPS